MRIFSLATFAVATSVIAVACSSSSSSSDVDAGSDASSANDAAFDTSTPTCSFVVGAAGAPTGACGPPFHATCTTTGPGECGGPSTSWNCECETTGWVCANPNGGGGICDAGPDPDADLDASSDVSDASDD